MEKTITFNIPKGYIIDKENSTDTNIVLKLAESTRVRTWEEYCKKMKGEISYYIDPSSGIKISTFGNCPFLSEFKTEEEVKAFAALSKLLKLRKDWVGNWKPNLANGEYYYVITNYKNRITREKYYNANRIMAFPTKEMRDEFFDCFKDYLEQAKNLI